MTEEEGLEEYILPDVINDTEQFSWTTVLTTALIETRLEMNELFKRPKRKKVEVWDLVAEKLRQNERALWVTGLACDTKWRNLMATFRKIKLSSKGNKKRRCYWEFFEILDDAYNKKIITEEILGATTRKPRLVITSKPLVLRPPQWFFSVLKEQRMCEETRRLEEKASLDRLELLEKQKVAAVREMNNLLTCLIQKQTKSNS